MRLLMKWLRPETVPSQRKKHLPFGTRLRLDVYRKCLTVLRKWYGRYAFSDMVTLPGRPQTKVCHEFRDCSFEAELKRMHMPVPEEILIRNGQAVTRKKTFRGLPHFRDFRFEDTMTVVMGGQRISVNRGQGDSFSSTLAGVLKETDDNSLLRKYIFTAAAPAEREQQPAKARGDLSTSISGGRTQPRPTADPRPAGSKTADRPAPASPRRQGPLFKDDPLLGKIKDGPQPASTPAPAPAPAPEEKPAPSIKVLDGVVIDDSF